MRGTVHDHLADPDGYDYNPTRDDLLLPARHLQPPEGTDCLAVLAAQVEAVRATFHDHESEAS